jgi:hypothetical protein
VALGCFQATSQVTALLDALSMKSGTAKRRLATPSSRQLAVRTISQALRF